MTQVRERLLLFVRDAIHPDIEPGTRLIEEGLLDSFTAIEIVSFIETEFDVLIDIEDLSVGDFASVDAMTGVVVRLVERAR